MSRLLVVNVRHEPYKSDPSLYVYVGRAGKGQDGTFGNPFRKEDYPKTCLKLYRDYLRKRCLEDGWFYMAVMKLGEQDKPLGCFCVKKDGSGECHAKILADFVEKGGLEA